MALQETNAALKSRIRDAETPERPEPETSAADSVRFDLYDIFGLIWRARLSIMVLSAIFAGLLFLLAVVASPAYRVWYVVAPAPQDAETFSSSGLGAIASLAMGRGQNPSFSSYLELITSTAVATDVADEETLASIFPDRWDAEAGAWREVSFDDLSLKGKLNAIAGMPLPAPPSAQSLAEHLSDNITIMETSDGFARQISIDARDPEIYRDLLDEIHIAANDLLRQKRQLLAEERRARLLEQMSTTTVNEYRQALVQSLMSAELEVVRLDLDPEYAAIKLEGPYISDAPVFPRPAQFIQLGILAGIMLGCFLAVFTPLSDRSVKNAVRRRLGSASATVRRFGGPKRQRRTKNTSKP